MTLSIWFVGRRIWEPLVNQAWSGLGGLAAPDRARVERLARLILTTFHNRHVGLTPALAVQLARRLSLAQVRADNGEAWGQVQTKLTQALLPPTETETAGAGNAPAQLSYSPLLSTRPLYVVMRVALPLAAEACQRLGVSYLFCEDDQATDVTPAAYAAYAQALDALLRRLALEGGEATALDLFWKEQAATLATLTRRGVVKARQRRATGRRPPERLDPSDRRLPEADAITLSYMLRLRPELPAEAQVRPEALRVRPPPRERVQSRRQEGGVVGLRLTRREEDLDSLVLSELLNPLPILADRLLNTGFLARQREPKHQPRRDLLLAAIMPAAARAHLSGSFAKGCWYHFLAELGYRLWRRGLRRSDFVWLEGDVLGRVRVCRLSLEDFPAPAFTTGLTLETFQSLFLTSLGWLPDFVDARGHFMPPALDEPDAQTENAGFDPLLGWCGQAWGLGLPITARRSDQATPLNLYSTVHVMALLPPAPPSVEGEAAPVSAVGGLHHALRLGDKAGRAASITRVPASLPAAGRAGGEGWRYEARERLPESCPEPVSEARLAGWLLAAWLSQMEKELGYG